MPEAPPPGEAVLERGRAERLRRALERGRQPRTYARPAWRTLAPGWEEAAGPDAPDLAQVERWRPRDRYADRHSDAEYAFYRVPGRFHRYAAEYLFASERILAFAPWTAEVSETWWSKVSRLVAPGGRQPPEGALVVTDRQVLLLRDDEQPVAGALFWGYTAHATTPERLAAVAVCEEARGRLRLRLYLRAGAGGGRGEIIEWQFPASAAAAVHQAVAVLRQFLPRTGETRLRRQGRIEPLHHLVVAPRPPERGHRRAPLDSEVSTQDRAALDAALAAALARVPGPDGRPRRAHASAIVPRAGARNGPRLVAVTQAHVLVVPLPGQGATEFSRLADVTSVELRHSPLGYHVAWTLGGTNPPAAVTAFGQARRGKGARGAPEQVRISFPMPAYPPFFAVFAALRQALTILPERADGPELPLAEDASKPAA